MSLDPGAQPYAAAAEPPLSWSAVFGGAVTALAVSGVLTLLAAGFGYAVSPFGLATRDSLAAFTPEIGAGAVAIQVVSAGLGGYLAGRLRPGWSLAHTDEAHFRDTAHGLLAWAFSTVAGVGLAALVLSPYADRLAGPAAAATAGAHASDIASQSALFLGLGMVLSAFIAAVAGRIGGLRSEEMRDRALS